MYRRTELLIDGQWVAPSTDAAITITSPHTEEVIGQAPAAAAADIDRAVAAARAAFDDGPWPRTPPQERIAAVQRLAAAYKERRGEMAELITATIGAPIAFSKRAQAQLPLLAMAAYTQVAGEYPWQEARKGFYGSDIRIAKLPVGVVAAIVPWNMPQFLTIGKVIPALLAGCTVVLKPAEESSLDALLFAEIVASADLPPGVVNVVPGDRAAGAHLVAHPGVDKVSFTGSTAAGRQVATACAQGLKQVTLELGGKSAAIVLADADPAATAKAIQLASLANSGQVCNALSRVLVPASRADDFVGALEAELAGLTVGDPTDPATQQGPLVAQRQQARVREYIEDGQRQGARLVVGGSDLPDGLDRGWYVRPTLFADADNSMRIAREEIFGPVLTVIPYRDEADAIAIANDSDYGLAGAVFTADTDRGLGIAARVRAGSFGVNQGYIMDPLAPYGGVKDSGWGRELGREGLEGYLVSQSISGA
ncbi:aldehyde dehydrogenase [Mycobacterium intermedium]|uniref:aldehyde dehydrogenase (NAD(+)) n=1 Tax=Mycobacterium intermedium TaxID=28445 RepID=A0A1E3SDQ3_MYCIE|nr:aldehyde dehydrogenase [Mycobacterium intermedium]MCV6963920.1 aldehyde dehydrogenase [Mycobacterium intermedium]ODR00260.1 aldehyde dehydrogenase [Mycobacterium intermedium]OPE47547.1 aldehyde dehydrogenase [Mycobacterium intermedium]ORA95384.1 aldehyde dehydrogenase [Mycobacterium intermedium]